MKQVADLTGVLDTTLRVWERRYGVVEPERSPGGYRLYTADQVARLRRMAALVAQGVPASTAARRVAEESLHRSPSDATFDDLDLVEVAASFDPTRLDRLLRDALGRAPIDTVCQRWLMPQLEALGSAWERGDINVAHEHFASAGVQRALGRVFDDAPPVTIPGRILVGLPPGAHHSLGLYAFATCLRQRGADVVYLGADVPIADWAVAASELQPRAAVLGVPRGARTPRAQEVTNRLRAIAPPILVWVGGSRAGRVPGTSRLPDDVAVAAQEVATALSVRQTA